MRLRRGELRLSASSLQKLLRPPGRQTNQALLIVLLLVFGTGVATVAVGSPDGAWVAIGHGICGMAVVLLIPWKSRVVRGGLRRARLSRWLSLLLAALALVTLIAGLGYATGLVRSIAGEPGLWVHIAVALTLVPLVMWHVWARHIRPHRTDLSRRACPGPDGASPARTRRPRSARERCRRPAGCSTPYLPSTRTSGGW